MRRGQDFRGEPLFGRELLARILPWYRRKEAVLILGPRRAGKTSLLKLLARRLEQEGAPTFYFDLEDPDDRDIAEGGPEAVKRWIGGRGVVLLDEFHLLQDPVRFVKLTVDWHPELKLFLTGSSGLRILSRLRDSLIGRVVEFHLYPLGFREFLRFRGEEAFLRLLPPEVLQSPEAPFPPHLPRKLLDLLHDYLLFGGFPEVVLAEKEEQKITLLAQIFRLYALRDLRDALQAVEEAAFERVFLAFAGSAGTPVNFSEIAREVGVSDKTVRRYVRILEDLFLVHQVPPWGANPRTEIKKRPKVYFVDTGLLSWAYGAFSPLERRPQMAGAYAETAVALALLIRRGPAVRVRYWRTKHGEELDFLWIEGERVVPIEVKFQARPGIPSGLRAFLRAYPAPQAVVVTRDHREERTLGRTRLRYIPLPWFL